MTLYRYFPDKEALIAVILEEKSNQFLNDIKEVTAKHAATREKLLAIFEYYNHWFPVQISMDACSLGPLSNLVAHCRPSVKLTQVSNQRWVP